MECSNNGTTHALLFTSASKFIQLIFVTLCKETSEVSNVSLGFMVAIRSALKCTFCSEFNKQLRIRQLESKYQIRLDFAIDDVLILMLILINRTAIILGDR